jgi:hypothetical protein
MNSPLPPLPPLAGAITTPILPERGGSCVDELPVPFPGGGGLAGELFADNETSPRGVAANDMGPPAGAPFRTAWSRREPPPEGAEGSTRYLALDIHCAIFAKKIASLKKNSFVSTLVVRASLVCPWRWERTTVQTGGAQSVV